MKKLNNLLFSTIFLLTISIKAQNVGINNANLAPDPSAGLDVNYTDKGLLIPRVSLTGTNDVTTVPGAATSLLVYNTATVSDVTPGYYFWDGTQWVRLLNTGNAGGLEWLLNGNAGTTAGTNFLGTTDAQDLVFKTNNIENMRISNTTGNVGIGTITPSELLHLYKDSNDVKIYLEADPSNINESWNPAIEMSQDARNIRSYIGLIHGVSGGKIAITNPVFGLDSTKNTLLLLNNHATNGSSSTMQFGINDTIAMTIANNKKIGIGTNIPTSKFQVIDRYDTTQLLIPYYTTAGNLPGISAYDNNDFIGITTVDRDNNLNTTDDADGMIYWGDNINAQDLRFTFMRWNSTRLVPTDRMIIKSSGNVGIGLNNPSSKLHVNGDVRVGPLNPSGTGSLPGFGNRLYFSGGPAAAFDSDNSDPLWIARYNVSNDESELRMNLSDNCDVQSSFVIQAGGAGCTANSVFFRFTANGLAYKPGGGSWLAISDKRLKKNISEFNEGLEVITKIKPVRYQYNGEANTPDDGQEYIGVIAQELIEIAPFMVKDYQNEYLSVDPSAFTYLMINSIKQLYSENQELKKQLEELKELILQKQ
jgi:hypothetical protein